MSKAGMIGMDLAARGIVSVGETLDEEEWQLPSAASGWSVQDVVVHAGCLLGDLMAAVGGEVLPDLGIEALNDIQVGEKRGWASRQAVDFFQQQLEKALATFEPAATMTSSKADFPAWSTTRRPWEPLVAIDGDHDAAQRFLTAINLT